MLYKCFFWFLVSIVGTPTPAASYDYGYGRAAQTYDTTKTYYQQAGTTYATPAQTYDAAAQTVAKVACLVVL